MTTSSFKVASPSFRSRKGGLDLPPPPPRPSDLREATTPNPTRSVPRLGGDPHVLMSNTELLSQIAHMGNTVNRMAERMQSLERERRLPECTRRSPDRRHTSTRDRRPPLTSSRRHSATERLHRPGKEPVTDLHRRIEIYQGTGQWRSRGGRRSPPGARYGNQEGEHRRNSQSDDDDVILNPGTQASRRPRPQEEQALNRQRIDEHRTSYERMEEDTNRDLVLLQNSQGGHRASRNREPYQFIRPRESTPQEPTYQHMEPTPQRSIYPRREPVQQQTEPIPQQGFPYQQRVSTPQQRQNPYLAMPSLLQQEHIPHIEPQGGTQTIPGLEGINVNALRRLIAQSEGQGGAIPDAAPSPFSTVVREAPLPPTFRGTGDLRFNGSTDPAEYIGRFNTEMELYQVGDLTKCRLLASTLRGNAHQWFQKLGPASITSWEQMRKMFLIQFQSSIHYAPPVTTLANIKQRDGETLQEYFKRFNAEVPTVRGASEEIIKNFLIAGVRVGTDFWKNLQREEPSTLAALYLQADPFKREEEALKRSDYGDAPRRSKRKERSPSPKTEKKNGRGDVNLVEDGEPTCLKSLSPKGNKGRDRFIRSRSPSPRSCPPPPPNRRENQTVPRKYYTPLTASIDYIYEITKSQGLYKKPTPLSRSATKDKGRYCAYHESHGHHTYACRQLKEDIEKLIKEGQLTDWVVKEVKKYKEEVPIKVTEVVECSREEKELEKPVFIREESIHTIFGGPHIGGDERNVIERYVREAQHPPLTNVNHLSERPPKLFKGEDIQIIFSEEDARWVHHPHSDALVVNVRIGPMNVHRVFVDTGSSVNILYYGTFKKMGLLDKEPTQGTTHIYGFTGDSVRVKGTIRLPLTLGEGSLSATQVFDFLVVDQPTHYNALLGRPVLKEMRIVTSIYHMSMKFPTPNGVGCIKGCQYDSHDCYSRMIKSSRKGSKGVGEDSDMPDFDQESMQETQVSFKPPHASTNMVYTIEFPEEGRLQEYEVLAINGTPIFFLEAPPFMGRTADMIKA
ncbi:hypothetical protein POM88_017872 [Heracleum sosnowskyi]|uniref:Retrotransposon gag domain-containing protein n=1 Tax=Heracleum sosnowskyi TaxID=360622 RepID=A0AAD8IPE9_9APIA|nr:hypothetical protein POM88_017872 [Heracleum sosnowskyi]